MIYLGWTLREQGNAWVAEKPGASPPAPKIISWSEESARSRIRIYEGCAAAEDLEWRVPG